MDYSSLDAIRTDLGNGKITVSSLTESYLTKISENADINAFNEVFTDYAREQAQAVDAKLAAGTAGKLAGLVIGIKDNICIKGQKVTASSKILENFESLFSATVVERLIAEDAVIIGRLNCDEFAMGSSNENSSLGPVLNPLDKTRVPGGSSGGSAAAVAARFCLAALGSDTGGSIRQPAAFCGNVGLKPTYGRVSRWGLLAYASSFDQIGPITNCAADAAEIMSVIAGFDENDATSSSHKKENYQANLDGKKLRVAYLGHLLENESIKPEIRKAYADAIEQLRTGGHELISGDFNYFDYLVPAYYVLTTAEASSNLARYDGIRYGRRSPNTVDLETAYKKSRSEGFGKEVKNRIMLGTFVLSAGFYDAYYGKAQKVRRVTTNAMHRLLENCDVLLIPTTPDVAFKFGENSDDPIKMYLQDIFTVLANITGHPAISFPYGKTDIGLPIGLQAIGRYFDEDTLLAVSGLLEKK